ncbi:LysM peptidoglycan-binding domain-containing protein [Simkania negevensis]|uniref:LysM peptidoglycan-binding domain-containing protein n=1 Tax=Simkania negevensis TaxID=83561 RepID=A0ABS3ARA3_9BACT|nr:LysM peptidoglycan-binding domain-containing protein [Simkania negevensis]
MRLKRLLTRSTPLFAFIACAGLVTGCFDPESGNQPNKSQLSLELDTARRDINDLQFELKNIKVEQQIFENHFSQKDSSTQAMQEQLSTNTRTELLALKKKVSALEERINQVNSQYTALPQELKTLQQHANQTSSTMAQFQKEIQTINKTLDTQIAELTQTTQSIVKAVQKNSRKTPSSSGSTQRLYTIQAGDTLEHIARDFNTSISAIKSANNLSTDRIYVGQDLVIP